MGFQWFLLLLFCFLCDWLFTDGNDNFKKINGEANRFPCNGFYVLFVFLCTVYMYEVVFLQISKTQWSKKTERLKQLLHGLHMLLKM